MMYLIATTMMELIYTIKKGRGGYPSRPCALKLETLEFRKR
jgi:hypothetical protein